MMIKSLISNIVVAISGSGASISAAKYAIIMAKHYKCRLSVVYVVDTATIRQLALSKIFVPEEGAEYEESLVINGKRYLTFVEELARAKGVRAECEMRKGSVANEILAVADEKKADLIILGGWEKDRDDRDVIGHNHREIQIHSKCSVLVVKERDVDLMYKQA
jgi:nucleotide-binding universal stress UspA family protein